MSNLVLLSTVVFALSAQDAPDRIISQYGVDMLEDEQIFTLFSALNAAGYSDESKRKGPPLNAPVYHPIRVELRDELRKVKRTQVLDELQRLFSQHPAPLEAYIQAAMTDTRSPASAEVVRIRQQLLPLLKRYQGEAETQKLMDKLAEKQREHVKQLKVRVDQDLQAAASFLHEPVRAPTDFQVIPNLLDTQNSRRRMKIGTRSVLLVGADLETARSAIVSQVLSAYFEKATQGLTSSNRQLKRAWDEVRRSRRIRTRYTSGDHYLAEALGRALAFRVSHKGRMSSDLVETFSDEQAKEAGMRWIQPALQMLDAAPSGSAFSGSIARLISRASF